MIPTDRIEALKPARGFLIALIVCLILWAIVFGLLFLVLSHVPVDKPYPALSGHQKIRIERYMKERKIRPQVILIHWNGKMTYEINGRRCEIK